MPFAVVNDISMYYEEHGAGEALLFISGQNTDHSQWAEFATHFTDRYRVIVFDHRGTGRSDKPSAPPYSTQGFAADAVALLHCLEIQRAHVFGASMGGRVAQWLAIDHAERFASVTLAATSPGDRHGVARGQAANAALAARSDGSATSDPLLPYLVSTSWSDAHPSFIDALAVRRFDPQARHARRLHFEASQSHDAWTRLGEISVPVLVLHGDNDEINPTDNAAILAEQIPGAELRLISSGRHEFFAEFPEMTADVVRAFLDRHPIS